MGAKTLREDFAELKGTVNTFCAGQAGWNEAHDKHSREVLAGIEKSTDKLFTMQESMIEKFGKLPCAEHGTRMESIRLVANAKISSVEKRVKWIWGIIGGSVGVTMFGFFLKNILDYLKPPVV